MRKLFFLSIVLISALSSCKQDKNDDNGKISPDDAKAVSSAISLWHGARTQGNPPVPNNNPNGPVIDPFSNNQTIKAAAGRYAIIQPELVSGAVAGYYIKVNGASEFFKVDYKKPREGGRTINRFGKHARAMSRMFGIDSTGGGTLDSSIVIVIPSSIQPGQFCTTYWAYDSLGNVSNPISVCINVVTLGGDASTSYLNGSWNMTGYSEDTTSGWEPMTGVSDTSFSNGYCVNNHIIDSFFNGPLVFPRYIYSVTQAKLSFSSNGGLNYLYTEVDKEFNYNLSTCSNFVFDTYNYTDNINGAWSYNSNTGKLVIIFDFDDLGLAEPEAYEYKLIKLSNSKVYLKDEEYGEYLRMEK